MDGIVFKWDASKNSANRRKHGVSFEEAQTIFFDANAWVYFDPDHSGNEDRFIMIGNSFRFRVLVVCHCHREGNTIRIISARRADSFEEASYWERL